MKTQKELKDMYVEIITNEIYPNSKRSQEFAKKNCEHIVELSNGDILTIDKPKIEKSFYFGIGINGIGTIEDFDNATAMAEYTKRNVDYFIEKNIEPLREIINELKYCLKNYYSCYTYVSFVSKSETCLLVQYRICDEYLSPDSAPGMWNDCKKLRKLDNNDIQLIINGYEEVVTKFNKRLNTYLNRYGLSKVETHTYLVD